MSNERINESCSYRIGYFLGSIIYKAVRGFFHLLWAGIITTSKRNKWFFLVYGVLALASIFVIGTFNNGMVLVAFLILALAMGIWEEIKQRPIKKQRKYFNRVFEQIQLQSSDGRYPFYLGEYPASEYIIIIAFNSFIPLSVWENKKDLLEMHMDTKILEIKQDADNCRVINLLIQDHPLPTMIEWSDDYINGQKDILNIGVGLYGIVGMNLEKQPHAFVAGETGGGKSNIMKAMIHQAILKDYDVVLIDFKRGVSFTAFEDVVTICYEYPTVLKALKEAVQETKRRLDLFRELKVDNIKDYNNDSGDYLPRKVIFIDELAELLKTRDKETSNILTDCIETLCRLSRAVGINLIMGIQRPDSTIINGQIKNNVSYRICGRFADPEPSRIMIGNTMAANLPDIKGRFLVNDDGIKVVQCFYFDGAKAEYKVEETEKPQEEIVTIVPAKMPPEEPPVLTDKLEFDFSDIDK